MTDGKCKLKRLARLAVIAGVVAWAAAGAAGCSPPGTGTGGKASGREGRTEVKDRTDREKDRGPREKAGEAGEAKAQARSKEPEAGRQQEEAGADELEAEGSESINLIWSEAPVPASPEQVTALPKGAALADRIIVPGTAFSLEVYTINNDEDYVYGMLATDAGRYDLGPVGTWNYRGKGDVKGERVNLFGDTLLKVTGSQGANSSLSQYYRIMEGRAPEGVVKVDTGHAMERDMDGDGEPDIVANHGTPLSSYIYIRQGSVIRMAAVHDAIGDSALTLTADGVYETYGRSKLQAEITGRYRLGIDGRLAAAKEAVH